LKHKIKDLYYTNSLYALHAPKISTRKRKEKQEFLHQYMKTMDQEERGAPNYELQVSFSNTPQAIHEMGFVQFEDNQVLSFLAPSQSSQMSQPLSGGGTATTATTTTTGTTSNTNPTTMGFSHNDLVSRSSWNNNDQVVLE
jgi:hypothetical protein